MENIDTLVRAAREKKGATIQDASKALNLRERHIQMLEEGRLNELSKEIYLKGFIKTYTNWLNIDGTSLISTINHEKKKILTPRHTAPSIMFDFSYVTDFLRRPGINIFILSTILTAAIYTLWYHSHNEVSGVDIVSSIEQVKGQQAGHTYSNVLHEYRGKELVLFPHADVELKITNTQTGEEVANNLVDGDLFFLNVDDSTEISTEKPQSIEVFIDNGEEQTPIGMLDNILIKGLGGAEAPVQ